VKKKITNNKLIDDELVYHGKTVHQQDDQPKSGTGSANNLFHCDNMLNE